MRNSSIRERLARTLAADNASLEQSFARHRAAGGTLRNAFIVKSIYGSVRSWMGSRGSFRLPVGMAKEWKGE